MGTEDKEPVVAVEDKPDTREAFKKEKKRFGEAVKIAVAVSKAPRAARWLLHGLCFGHGGC
jgi:hypothetical protein